MEIGKGRPSDESGSLAHLWPGLSLSLVLVCTSMVYLPSQKPTFQFNLETVDMESYLVESPMQETHYNYYYFFIVVVIKRDYCIGMNEEVLLSIFC